MRVRNKSGVNDNVSLLSLLDTRHFKSFAEEEEFNIPCLGVFMFMVNNNKVCLKEGWVEQVVFIACDDMSGADKSPGSIGCFNTAEGD